MWQIRLFLFLITYLMANLDLSDVKIWKLTTESTYIPHRQRLSCLQLNNKHIIWYDPIALGDIGDASQQNSPVWMYTSVTNL